MMYVQLILRVTASNLMLLIPFHIIFLYDVVLQMGLEWYY
jgi:hypothetical protein